MGRRSYADERFWIEEDEVSHVDVMCYGASTGSLAVIVHGGMPPYKFSIDGENWQSEEYFDNLPVPANAVKSTDEYGGIWIGEYTMYCKDARGVLRTAKAKIQSPVEQDWIIPNLENIILLPEPYVGNIKYKVLFVCDAGHDYVYLATPTDYVPYLSTTSGNLRYNRTAVENQYSSGEYVFNYAVQNRTCGTSKAISFNFCVAPRRLPNAVQDYDGNWYDAVIIGNQVWLGSNLKTTHYANGDQVSGISSVYDGYAYSWNNVMNVESASDENPSGVQGIAPNGWHIPSRAEFNELRSYVSSQEVYILGNNTSYIAKALCSTSGWKSDTTHQYGVGNNQSANNLTLLNIKPDESNGMGTSIWSSTTDGTTVVNIYYLSLRSFSPDAVIGQEQNGSKHPVRCVCDMNALDFIKWYWNTYGSFDHQLS